MIDRNIFPFGWACPSGHIEKDETPEEGLMRETKEETGLEITKFKKIFDEYLPWNECSKGARGHHWHVYEIEGHTGRVDIDNREAKDWNWVPIKELKDMELEEAWEYWFKKLGYLI